MTFVFSIKFPGLFPSSWFDVAMRGNFPECRTVGQNIDICSKTPVTLFNVRLIFVKKSLEFNCLKNISYLWISQFLNKIHRAGPLCAVLLSLALEKFYLWVSLIGRFKGIIKNSLQAENADDNSGSVWEMDSEEIWVSWHELIFHFSWFAGQGIGSRVSMSDTVPHHSSLRRKISHWRIADPYFCPGEYNI